MPFVIGLTGGIGSGKTTVANLFASMGAGLVDTDEIAHRLTQPGEPAIAAIGRAFGPEYIATDGSLDRIRMRNLVFANASARRDLETILHPLIRKESARQIAESTTVYVMVVVPLLIESGAYRDIMTRVLVVDCEQETQIRRVMDRSALSRNEVLSIIASQATRQSRLAVADDVIHNDGDLDTLRTQATDLHRRYVDLAKSGGVH